MKAQIVYVKGHEGSEKQANAAYKSAWKNGLKPELVEGFTRKTIHVQRKIIQESRLHNFKKENVNRFLTKCACAHNHIKFWERVVKQNETMIFLEHDAVVTMPWGDYEFDEYLILNGEFVFRPPNKLALQQYKNFEWSGFGVTDLPDDYPLKYYRENSWKDSDMAPGTGAYALTPKGAKRLLSAVDVYGFDQSDFMINSYNVNIQVVLPSPVKFAEVNLSTSYGT